MSLLQPAGVASFPHRLSPDFRSILRVLCRHGVFSFLTLSRLHARWYKWWSLNPTRPGRTTGKVLREEPRVCASKTKKKTRWVRPWSGPADGSYYWISVCFLKCNFQLPFDRDNMLTRVYWPSFSSVFRAGDMLWAAGNTGPGNTCEPAPHRGGSQLTVCSLFPEKAPKSNRAGQVSFSKSCTVRNISRWFSFYSWSMS